MQVSKDAYSKIFTTTYTQILDIFEKSELNNYNIETLKILSEEEIVILINRLCITIKTSTKINEKNNYKLVHYQPLIEFIIKIILHYTDKYNLLKKINIVHFLSIVSKVDKAHLYLNKFKHLITNEKILDKDILKYLLNNSAANGSLLTFIFWKDLANIDIYSDESNYILINAIKNSDDRIFNWYIKELKNNNHDKYFQKSSTVINVLDSILNSSIPEKFQLKRIRILSENCNLVPYFGTMIDFSRLSVLKELFKYYYKTPLGIEQIINIVSKYNYFSNFNNNNDIIKTIFTYLKTTKEKNILSYSMATLSIICCNNNLENIHNIDFDNKTLEQLFNIIGPNIERQILLMGNENSTLEKIFTQECQCGQKCFSVVIKKMCKSGYFHKSEFNYKINNLLQLLTKFHQPSYDSTIFKKYSKLEYDKLIKINKLLSFLRIIAKKRSKNNIISFQSTFYPVMKELLNFTPSNKPILKNGSINWQNKKNKFTHVPPRHILPYEINIYNNFLLREKADGILINNLPINITRMFDSDKFNDIFMKEIKAEYIEDLELYLIFDINIPNTSLIERYEFLRNNHPSTKNLIESKITNLDELILGIKNERIIFNKFLEETKNEKIRWYPKIAFLINNPDEKFKKDIIENIIYNSNSDINNFINKEGPFGCDGLILSPLSNNYNFRDIKIKPKDLMTIDLLYDGKNWLDKEKNNYNHLIITSDNKYTKNIYRCYPKNNLLNSMDVSLNPLDIRYDKKYPNSRDIVTMIQKIYNFNWIKDIKYENPYYHLVKPTNKLSKKLIIQLEKQNEFLSENIEKLNPENGKTWLDLGCGKSKLISHIKKYNPSKYVGLDVDINILLNNLYLIDEYDWIKLSPCNLKNNWKEDSKWYNIENQKYDYIILNFSLMHLFDSELFWIQLKEVCKPTSKIIFNLVSERIKNENFIVENAFMKYFNEKIIYFFPWSHTSEVEEQFISNKELDEKLNKYDFKKINVYNKLESNNSLISLYDWYIVTL